MTLVERIRGTVRDGRLVVDQPTSYPEGTEIELIPIDYSAELEREVHEAWMKVVRQRSQEFDNELVQPIDAADVASKIKESRTV